MSTSANEKKKLDEQVARFFFASNSAFQKVENDEFKHMCQMLRPGYNPPSADVLANNWLDVIHSKEQDECVKIMENQHVCLALDGWTNVRNEPIICACITKENGKSVLVDTVDTSGNQHDSTYLKQITEKVILNTEDRYKCKVGSVVTDNPANMKKMRDEIGLDNDNLITYGCSAHILNLLAKDFSSNWDNIIQHVLQIVKYFRNHHRPKSWYINAGGSSLILPQEVRWNTMCGCLEAFLKNWVIIYQVCEDHSDEIDENVRSKVINIQIKKSVEEVLKIFRPIAIALDKVQSNSCKIGDAVIVWKKLENELIPELTLAQKKKFEHRYNMALKTEHFAAFSLMPSTFYGIEKLTDAEINGAMTFMEDKFSLSFIPMFMKFRSKMSPFDGPTIKEQVVTNMSAYEWWKSFKDIFPGVITALDFDLISQLTTAIASSAAVERNFSTFGLVHTKLRNRLGVDRAAKLTFLYRQLNQPK